ncbi:putative zinc finger CCHC domain-containing protein 3-like [Apostichopus japonicus]|uniref:Putative zinc finger CCHC domain-containing protein 3-like n=1 Tax=Stichopus japonicus TaxID=307972 RepID=A0A2G8JJG6_STIJA|nr:putative zinc finger CCHC domain-containing protein 3-like [Apostichopus japonicus]
MNILCDSRCAITSFLVGSWQLAFVECGRVFALALHLLQLLLYCAVLYFPPDGCDSLCSCVFLSSYIVCCFTILSFVCFVLLPCGLATFGIMASRRDSRIVKLSFTGEQAVPPVQVFSILKSKGVVVPGEVDALQALQGRNTYDLRFTSDVARQKGVTLLSNVEGMTVTPYERSVWVTIIHVGLEVRQELVVTVLGRFGAVKAAKMCSYAQAPGVLNGHRQVRIDLKQDIPSFLFIAGHKAHVRYPGQPRTCFRCGETGHEAKGCPNKKCGRCLRLGHDSTACPNEVVCSLCGKEGHVFRACPSSYVSRTKSGGKSSSDAPTTSREEGESGGILPSPAPGSPSPVVADPNPVPAPRKSPPASPSTRPVPSPVRRRYRQIRRLCLTENRWSSILRRFCLTATPVNR